MWPYILKSFNYVIHDDLAVNIDKEFESVIVEVKAHGSSILVGEIY